jgi:hypothetical protein
MGDRCWLAGFILILLFSGPGRIPESADPVNIQFGRKSELLLLKFHTAVLCILATPTYMYWP